MRSRSWMLRFALLVPLIAGLAACGASESDSPDGQEVVGPGGEGTGLRGDTLVVNLEDFMIVVPDTLPARELRLIARNRGVEDHNFEVMRGDELVWKFDDEVGPQRTREALIALEPGEYSVVCTVAGHDSRGMFVRVTVVEDPETEG